MPNPARFPACASLLALALLAPMSHAQTPYAPNEVTASDYARAESMLTIRPGLRACSRPWAPRG